MHLPENQEVKRGLLPSFDVNVASPLSLWTPFPFCETNSNFESRSIVPEKCHKIERKIEFLLNCLIFVFSILLELGEFGKIVHSEFISNMVEVINTFFLQKY